MRRANPGTPTRKSSRQLNPDDTPVTTLATTPAPAPPVTVTSSVATTTITTSVGNNAASAAPLGTNIVSTYENQRHEDTLRAMQKQLAKLESSLKETQGQLHVSNSNYEALKGSIQNSSQLAATAVSTVESTFPSTLSMTIPSVPCNASTVPRVAECLSIHSGLVTQQSAPTSIARYTSSSYVSTPSVYFASTPTNSIVSPRIANGAQNGIANGAFANTSLNAALPTATTRNIAYGMMNSENSSQMLQTSRKLQDLPDFSGRAEDWPIFSTAYSQSTVAYNYSNLENCQRLQKALKGEAREAVLSLLIHPDNVSAVLEQLQFRFGRPEQLIRCQLRQIREVVPITEHAVERLIPFATKCKNLAVFLQSVNGDQHLTNPTLLEELVRKLPMSKKLDWAKYASTIRPYPTIRDFSNWLSEIANLICLVQDVGNQPIEPKRRMLFAADNNRDNKCPICQGGGHKISDCRKFLERTVNDRWSDVKRNRICFACLESGHSIRNCRQRKSCGVNECSKKHHNLLHNNKPASREKEVSAREAVLSVACPPEKNKLLFRILPVTLHGPDRSVNTFALLDEGSSVTMIDNSLVNLLGLRGMQCRLNLQWFEGKSSEESATLLDVRISGQGKSKQHIMRHVYGINNLCLPMQTLNKIDLSIESLSQLPIEPYYNATPQVLIGLDNCHLGVPAETIASCSGGPYAANTKLGWVIFGPTKTKASIPSSCLMISKASDQSLHELVEDYFSVESFGVRPAPIVDSDEGRRAKKILQETTRKVNGRYETGLLWKSDFVELPDSYAMAKNRLVSIERKMKRDEVFAAAYTSKIQSYVDKGYARKLEPVEVAVTKPTTWYLPHFAVENINKPGKLRLVFDAGATVNGVSLNSYLLKGPQEYQSMPSVLFNFRKEKIGICGDITEMFHQVKIRAEDRCAQRFLWREGKSDREPDIYEMSVMIFGAACSPCAAKYVITVNALEHRDQDKRAIQGVLEHHYVDDFVDSFATAEEAIRISAQVRDIHKNAGFQLCKFASNSPEVVAALCNNEDSAEQSCLTTEKVLGMYWQSFSDTFEYRLQFNKVDKNVITGLRVPTKRELLSIVMSVFDPLGFLCHFMIAAKLLLREVWRHNVRWDDPLPPRMNEAWCKWREAIKKIVEVRIPRHYFKTLTPITVQLHVFVDASEDAFAAVAYWRAVDDECEVEVTFVSAKTKCAPLKPMTVPRLELQAAVLGARLMKTIRDEHSMKIDKCFLWSDSMTVIKWIGSISRRYKPFVAHRIAEILSLTEVSNWRWVPTLQNVADEATRPNCNVCFEPKSRWLSGPEFLSMQEGSWPARHDDADVLQDDDEELRSKFTLLTVSNSFIDFNRFSLFIRLKRTMAWVLRYVDKCRKHRVFDNGHGLTAAELDAAVIVLCRQVQAEAFSNELNALRDGRNLKKNSTLYLLSPYIDDSGILRVNGRIDAASWLPMDTRRPIILPPDHHFSRLLAYHHHSQMKHQNIEAAICQLRRKFWVPRIRSVMRKVITNCNVCKINRASPVAPLMGPLPADRLTPYVRPFTYTGLDYFGPVIVTVGRHTEKRWVALFTCLSVRAIHLEVAADLSTDACIIAIRNFINRRGVPLRIRSDNGKNFVGVNAEAQRFEEVFDCKRIQDELSTKGIEWWFNWPYNPAEGGVWERMVQCVKRVLRQTLKEVAPKEQTLQCFLIEAENVVNSRPLTHLPISADQEEPLTPNHFLLGAANNAQTPSVREVELPRVLRKQWRIARQLRDQYWKRWILEYLPTLTRRVKWCERTEPLKIGDKVFLCDPNLPRKEWRRGLVEQVHRGVDGEVRRVDVRTSTGISRRPVSRLAVLDME